jgi:uroporphyrinogen-III synthase
MIAASLKGAHVLVTRPGTAGLELCNQIKARGGQAVYFPTIDFAPPSDEAVFEQAILALGEQDWLIFVSPQAVYSSIPSIRKVWPVFPPHVRFAAVGAGTAKALHHAGYLALYPDTAWHSEGLLSLAEFQPVQGKKIAIIRGEGGRELIDNTLKERGAHVLSMIAYQRVIPSLRMNGLEEGLRAINVIVTTSYEGVRNLNLLLSQHWPQLKMIPLIVVSERIKALAHDLGFQTIWIAHHASHEAILDALVAIQRGSQHDRSTGN